MDRSFQGLVGSLVFHFLVAWWLIHHATHFETPLHERPLEISVVERKGPEQSFVKEVGPDPGLTDLKDQARFLSQFNRRVREQTRAILSGETKNRDGQAPLESDEQRAQGTGGDGLGRGQNNPMNTPGVGPMAGSGNANPFGKNVVVGQSTLGEYIPGIKEGQFTALNTDRFTFYTFYSRVNDQLRGRWVKRLREYTRGLSPAELNELAQIERVTQVEVVLDRAGRMVRVGLLKSSGDRHVDAAAVEAFREAAPFPNPPQGMVQDDGLIRINYGFIVQWSPQRVSIAR